LKRILPSLLSLLLGGVSHTLFAEGTATNPTQTNPAILAAPAPVSWGDATWHLQSDPASGVLLGIENGNDPHHMDWLRQPGHWDKKRNWIAAPFQQGESDLTGWGFVEWNGHRLSQSKVVRTSEHSWESTAQSDGLKVTVIRKIDQEGDLAERYEFTNTGTNSLSLPMGSLSITAPFFDQYPESTTSITSRCNTHLWTGGSSAWVNAVRIGAEAPHLGLAVTGGSLDAYSQRGNVHNDRGLFLLHPGPMTLKPGESQTLSWKLFWHRGWDDFFAKLKSTPGFVRMSAREYVVSAGQPLEITADTAGSLDAPVVSANGSPVPFKSEGGHLSASIPTDKPGDLLVELDSNSRKTWLRAFVTPPVDDLIEARLKFIIRKQQRHAQGTPGPQGDPLDGAYLVFDNETGKQVFDAKWRDHNAGRERLAMGVLGALYLPRCKDPGFREELKASLLHYSEFLTRELEDEEGVVYEDTGRQSNGRLYNYPWVARFHLAMYRATGDTSQLARFVRVMRSYYRRGGGKFYSIGIPITDGLKALREAGRTAEYEELLGLFRSHADVIAANGLNYPRFEVNFEQSIVAPAVQLLLEVYLATGEKRYLEAAKLQMPVLEAFAGRQPDSRLNEITIRHWDDFWFGKLKLYGDTLPHYWSTINALAYAYYGLATGEPGWSQRADTVLKGNLSLFTPEGTGSCAHLDALTINGKPATGNDPWANDQDWALVHLLMVRDLEKSNQ
jgi:hypothetical protein